MTEEFKLDDTQFLRRNEDGSWELWYSREMYTRRLDEFEALFAETIYKALR